MAKQLALALRSPADHGDVLHPGVRHGTVLIWQRAMRRQWDKVEPKDDLARALSGHVGEVDRFFTPNEFNRWRRVDLLRSLRSCYVDIDDFRDWPSVVEALEDQRLPAPSLIVESGRGLHFYWPHDAVPSHALPVWQAIQDRLVAALQSFGSDPRARDCTRVLRIVGSINGKNGEEVRGWILSPRAWTLHELADEVLGPRKTRKAEVVTLEAARSKRAASVHQKTGTYRLWYSRFQDLTKIADYHAFMQPRGIEPGNRDTLLFLLGTALSWFAAPDTLAEAIDRIARTYTPSFSDREVMTYTKPLMARAMAAARGETVEFKGKQRDPRYAFRTETLREWLGDLLVPELEARLAVLGVPKSSAELAACERERQRGRSRVTEGRYGTTRSEYLAKADGRVQQAQELHKRGLSQTAIAAQLGTTQGRVSQLLKCAPLV
jgi:hypothetical protein